MPINEQRPRLFSGGNFDWSVGDVGDSSREVVKSPGGSVGFPLPFLNKTESYSDLSAGCPKFSSRECPEFFHIRR
jgi:hypothetical protein